jgi:hypothetical protein
MFPFASLGKCNAVKDYDGGGGGLGCRDDGMLALPSAPPNVYLDNCLMCDLVFLSSCYKSKHMYPSKLVLISPLNFNSQNHAIITGPDPYHISTQALTYRIHYLPEVLWWWRILNRGT